MSDFLHLPVARLALAFALLLPGLGATPDAIVATDGSGHHRTVQAAIDAAPSDRSHDTPWTILIQPGRYEEIIYVQREKRHVVLRGADAAGTIITGALHAKLPGPDGKPLGTFRTATMHIDADDFTVENLTVENTAGPVGQALAIRVDGDRVVFRDCRLLGHQDTVLVNRGRHLFQRCEIVGTTDFIFGGATAYFLDCDIVCHRNSTITAASTPAEHPYGLVFDGCRVRGASPDIRVYLGRPWRDHAAVTFLRCELGEVVRPEGWHNWNRPEREQTSRYFEYGNTGPGADRTQRAPWSHVLTHEQASRISPATVLGGADGWLPLP